MLPSDSSGSYNPHYEQEEHHRKMEQNLRLTIGQRDKTICVLTIQNENYQKENERLLEQLSQKKQLITDLHNLNKRANRLDKKQCYAEIDRLQK